jgi:hypothetical protein
MAVIVVGDVSPDEALPVDAAVRTGRFANGLR